MRGPGALGPDTAGAGVESSAHHYAELSRQARDFAARARSEATTKAYDSDWRHFTAWCARYGQAALPAAPQTLANYLADHAPSWRDATDDELTRSSRRVVDGRVRTGARPATLRRRLAAIGVLHRAAGHDNPAAHQLVRDVLDGIARTPAAAGHRQARAATADPLTAMLAAMDPERDPRDARDAAVLLLGMTGALRRSELAALRIGDVALERDEGLEVTLAGSKTDQHHHGHTVAIPDLDGEASPRAALVRWLEWLGRRPHQDPADPARMTLPPGAPLWRPVSRRQGADPRARIGVRALSDRGISEVVKARA
ncbi:MAG: hypothetical protein INR63_11535, partial [Actinomycetospora chiangmaiensis]|nr:hypothetical protein [Actinomycetospora chiangmaiensis]